MIPPVPVKARKRSRGSVQPLAPHSYATGIERNAGVFSHSQLDSSQKLEEVSTVHVVQVEQQVLAVSGQFDSSQLWK